MEFRQNTAGHLRFVMIDAVDFQTPLTSLTHSDLVCYFAKHHEALAEKTLSAANARHLGRGVYEVDFTAAELDTLGSLVSQLAASGALPYYREDTVAPPSLTGVTIKTETEGGQPIPTVYVQVRDETGETVLAQGVTSLSGLWTVGLPPDTYIVELWRPGYTFAASPAVLVVDGDATEEYTGVPFTPLDPGGPMLTTVFGWLKSAAGVARAAVKITFTPVYSLSLGRPLSVNSTETLMSRVDVETTTDSEGYFEVQLVTNSDISPRGTRYQVVFADTPQDTAVITVPVDGPINIEDIIG